MTADPEPFDRDAFVARVRAERAALDERIATLDESTLTSSSYDDGNSIKDIIGHITAWERRLLTAVAALARGETPPWPEEGATLDDTDRLNERDFAAGRDRPLDQVLAAARLTFAEIDRFLDDASQQQLAEATFRPWPLWRIVDANTGEHYREHLDAIDVWLAGQGA